MSSTRDQRRTEAEAASPHRPRVSVYIPTRNRAAYLRQSIESVLAQTYADFRLVVSDNASTDETADVVASFRDERLRYDRLPEDIGLLGNFNRCLDDADTEYVLELADDEILYPAHLAESVAMLDANASAGIVHSAFDIIGPEGDVVFHAVDWTGLQGDVVEPGDEFIRKCISSWSRIAASTALIRTAALPPVRFDPADFPPTDFGLWLRMALDWDVAFLGSRPLAGYRIHPGSHSAVYGTYTPTGYIDTPEHVAKGHEIKIRFLDRFGDRFPDARELRSVASRSLRETLVNHAARRTLPERRVGATVRALAEAARIDRRVMLAPSAWRLLLASLLGRRTVEALKRRRRVRSTHAAAAGRD